MSADEGGGRRKSRIWRQDVQMQAALQAIERWERLSEEERARFKALAARRVLGQALDKNESKDLARLWKRLEIRGLLRELVRLALGR